MGMNSNEKVDNPLPLELFLLATGPQCILSYLMIQSLSYSNTKLMARSRARLSLVSQTYFSGKGLTSREEGPGNEATIMYKFMELPCPSIKNCLF